MSRSHAAGEAPRIPKEIADPLGPLRSGLIGGAVALALLRRFADALLRGDLLTPDWRRELLEFVPAAEGYDGYGLGVAKGKIGLDPEFVTNVTHIPANEITVAGLSSGDADLRLLDKLLTDTALEAA